MTDSPENNGTYQIITPPNALKARVGGELGIDPALAKKADAAVENMQAEFLQRAGAAVAEIAAQITLASDSDSDGGECAAEVHRIAHELQTQGAAFAYPLISDVSASLCRYLDSLDPLAILSSKIVCAHTEAIQSIICNSIQGDGGRMGQALIAGLNDLVAKSSR